MNKLEEIIIQQSRTYKMMEPQDAVKLLFQNEFGPGHMVHDFETALAMLTKEYEETKSLKNLPIAEFIGNGYSRLFPARLNTQDFPPELICKLFTSSARRTDGSVDSFVSKLAVLKKLCKQEFFSFSSDALEAYLFAYKKQGYPLVSHSASYKKAYSPFYRVIDSRYEKLLPFLSKTNQLLMEKENVILAIDGNCAAGKTTCAGLLENIFDCNIIHMDDFFLPGDLRTKERYGEAGGNIHYERFEKEVLSGLRQKNFTYLVFDCSASGFTERRTVIRKPLTVIEGSYSTHPRFQHYYDLSLFLHASSKEQEQRISARNGEAMYQNFKNLWIPMENRYFESFEIQKNCNFTISSLFENKG